jgi:hypothetical protein
MPLKSDCYPSKYFKAADVPAGWSLVAEVETARTEKFQGDRGGREAEKLVVYFKRQRSGLVVGPTVWNQFIEVTGEENSDDWTGHRVELFRDITAFGGKMVPCIRIRKPEEEAPTKKPSKPKAQRAADLDDSINDV